MNVIEKSWYQKFGISWLLLPLSGLFYLIALMRKWLYKRQQNEHELPVIVVGNIAVGGTGKTPFVLFITQYLIERGFKPGVISRGYGGEIQSSPLLVTSDISAKMCGDEPKLIAKRAQVPVVVSPNRNENIVFLQNHTDVDVIISDDGMQHYKMPRAVEVCIVDAKRMFGNRLVLPAGPLREPVSRLKEVDLTIYNGGNQANHYQLETDGIYRVKDNRPCEVAISKAHLVSAIGNPKRFEQSVQSLGIEVLEHSIFEDHHNYQATDFEHDSDNVIIMTEKDAVKCDGFAKDNWYYLRVSAKPSEAVLLELDNILKNKGIKHGF